jgi:nucleoside triphosphate pyrophosphatase
VLRPRIPVILASASPRRRQLLSEFFEAFEVISPEVDEEALEKPDPWENAKHLACCKAFKVSVGHPDKLVIGADTVVALPLEGGYEMLAKPKDPSDACRMLRALSGREHIVTTGVCLLWPDGKEHWATTSRVRFDELSDEFVEAYVATGEPLDKAGAYGAQGGMKPHLSVEGSLTNVIGLPIEDFEARLRATGLV